MDVLTHQTPGESERCLTLWRQSHCYRWWPFVSPSQEVKLLRLICSLLLVLFVIESSNFRCWWMERLLTKYIFYEMYDADVFQKQTFRMAYFWFNISSGSCFQLRVSSGKKRIEQQFTTSSNRGGDGGCRWCNHTSDKISWQLRWIGCGCCVLLSPCHVMIHT